MTLGIDRKQICEKLVQIAEDLKVSDNLISEWRTKISEGDGFNVEWNCRIDLMVLIVSQLTDHDLKLLQNSVTSRSNQSSCILFQQTTDQKIWVNGEKLHPHLFLYKMLIDPNVPSVNGLKTSSLANCLSSFYSNSDKARSSSCINPSHYEQIENLNLQLPQSASVAERPNIDSLRPLNSVGDLSAITGAAAAASANQPEPASSESEKLKQGILHPDTLLQHNVSYSQIVEYEPVRHWCSVAYYEGETKLSEVYQADENQFQIDGLTDPSSSQRFCLGIINRTSRDPLTRQIRRVIDQGIRLLWVESSQEMHVECLSEHAVFFQSHCFNSDYGFEPHSVVKIPSGSSACVFRLETFTKAIQYNLQLETYSYNRVYDLSTMCQVRISFVKGWGTSYRRAKITQCPCWVDITLNGPLHMLDKVLRYLHPPLSSLSSGSGGKNSPVQAAGTPIKGNVNGNKQCDLSKLALEKLESKQVGQLEYNVQSEERLTSNFARTPSEMQASGASSLDSNGRPPRYGLGVDGELEIMMLT